MNPSVPGQVEQAELFVVPKVGMRIFITPEEKRILDEIFIVRPGQLESAGIRLTASSLEIVEIGKGDKEGLLKVNLGIDHEAFPNQNVWVEKDSLLKLKSGSWKIDRRCRDSFLAGDRLTEIRNDSTVTLRRDDVREKILRRRKS